ncbi:MAG: hypothetical protein ACHQ50_04920 [Fimbriimonadales bacterium]
MVLKPQAVVVLVKIHALGGQPWTFAGLAQQLRLSVPGMPSLGVGVATIHESVNDATAAKLFDPGRRLPILSNLLEFLVHGVRYCYPASRGQIVRGVPTSYAASPLVSRFPPGTDPIPVWPFAGGVARGESLEPLHPCVPGAALADPRFGELMALIDGIREGDARVRQAAVDELTVRLCEG